MKRLLWLILSLVCLVGVFSFLYWRYLRLNQNTHETVALQASPSPTFDNLVISTSPSTHPSVTSLVIPPPTQKPEKMPNKYSVEAMRTRQYTVSDVAVESKVRETKSVVSYKISYTSDGMRQYALMSVPKTTRPKNGYPVLLFMHGWIYPSQYSTERSYAPLAEQYAANGFLVIKPDFRGNGLSEGVVLLDDIPLQHVTAQIEYAFDARNLIQAIGNIENADESMMFLFGHSMGGDVGLRVLEMYPQIKAATLWAPSVYWYPESQFHFIDKWYQNYRDHFYKQLSTVIPESEYKNVGALENVRYIQTPVIIHQADHDNVTPYLFGQTLASELEKAGKQVTLYTYSGTDHQLASNRSQVFRRDVEFFRSFLQSEP